MADLHWKEKSEAVPAPPDEFVLALLNSTNIASLATQRADGSIHLIAIWYLYKESYFYFPTSSSSQKVRNVIARPVATAMIDTRIPGQEQGVSVSGQATVIRGERGKSLVAEVHRCYLTEVALADPKVGPAFVEFDDVVIALKPTRWTTWDIAQMNTKQFGGLLGVEAGYLYPRNV